MSGPLERSSTDKVIAGVAGGLGKTFGIDPWVFRVIFLVVAILGISTGFWVYVALWLALPLEGGGPRGIEDVIVWAKRVFPNK